MIDITHMRPPGSPYQPYDIDDRLPEFLKTRGLDARTISTLLHDIGCGQMEALVRLSEALPSRQCAKLYGSIDDRRMLLFDAVLDETVTWSSGYNCAFLETTPLPSSVIALLADKTLGDVIDLPAIGNDRSIKSITETDEKSILVLDARLRPARRHVLRGASRGAAERQRNDQTQAFGDRKPLFGWHHDTLLDVLAGQPARMMRAGIVGAITGTLMGMAVGSGWRMAIITVAAAATPAVVSSLMATVRWVRELRVMRHGLMADHPERIDERLAEAVARHLSR